VTDLFSFVGELFQSVYGAFYYFGSLRPQIRFILPSNLHPIPIFSNIFRLLSPFFCFNALYTIFLQISPQTRLIFHAITTPITTPITTHTYSSPNHN